MTFPRPRRSRVLRTACNLSVVRDMLGYTFSPVAQFDVCVDVMNTAPCMVDSGRAVDNRTGTPCGIMQSG